MTHEEYCEKIREQQSIINRLFKSRENRSRMIDQITNERYKDIIGRFFKIEHDMSDLFPRAIDGYFYIYAIDASSNYVMSDRVEINLRCRRYGNTVSGIGKDKQITGVYYIEQTFCYHPSRNIREALEPLFVSKEEALKELKEDCERMINDFQKLS